MGIPGSGLVRGLAVTLRAMTRRAHTRQYPDVKPDLPPRSRGVIALLEENCTSCMLCARECPDWCIYIDSHKETVEVPGAARPRQRNVLDRFAIDFSLCMYCGICIDVCPFDALFWSPEFEYADYDLRSLLHEKDKLREWMLTVPAPPAHDPNGEPAKEVVAAQRVAAAERTPADATDTARPADATDAVRPADAPDTVRPADAGEVPDVPPAPAAADAADAAAAADPGASGSTVDVGDVPPEDPPPPPARKGDAG